MRFSSELTSLLFPSRCFGCRKLGLPICSICRKLWNSHNYLTHLESRNKSRPLSVFSSISYSPVAKNILLAAKENNHFAADELVKSAMKISIQKIFSNYQACAIVPVPSQRNSVRRRGRDFISELAVDVAQDFGVAVLNILTHTRKIRDQSQLNFAGRRENLSMALSIKSQSHGNYYGERVVVLDDLLTTGATLLEATRALRRAGFEVQAAATACVALRRRN